MDKISSIYRKENICDINGSYYTIIYAMTNSLVDEKIAIGLMVFNNEKRITRLSNSKTDIVKNILNKNSFELFIDSLKSFLNYDKNITNDYINYLHNYNLNLFHFGHAIKIGTELKFLDMDKLMDKLYKKFVSNI